MYFKKLKVIYLLGIKNIFQVLFYRLGVRFCLSPVRRISAKIDDGYFFNSPTIIKNEVITPKNLWPHSKTIFGWKCIKSEAIPCWHQNMLNGKKVTAPFVNWWDISDFNIEIGDIKGVWEVSRFDWVVSFAQHVATGDDNALTNVNSWLIDWVDKNPTYAGVNWKCGQEASIRVMHLALGALILKQTYNTSPALLSLIKAHLKRISPTIMYAVAQDNNHGTSEAAALYIGGSWLSQNGDAKGVKWQKQGLKWLENRANKLIEQDGSFSQYSVTYHRVMLDTYSLAEVWRQKHDLPCFSNRLYKKLAAATSWLFYFTDFKNGDAPNIGSNDGARLIPLTSTDFRDFRPSVQLASTLFVNKVAYDFSGDFNIPLQWLELEIPKQFIANKKPKDFINGGYTYLTYKNSALYFNYPMFKFRPSQCDALHIDFWLDGQNIFRDGGTFSYNAGQKYIDYYGGVKSHNTVEFDGHDQMPRLSRFLLGDWLKTSTKKELTVGNECQTVTAGYTDRFGCEHIRAIKLQPNLLIIKDTINGFKDKATLRFRLAPADWQIVGNSVVSELCTINFSADINIKRIELTTGYESRYYYQESEIPVLEIEVNKPGILTTEVKF